MADIPLVILVEIFCRLPVKSLIRLRSVSKEWKSLIQSSDFNYDYIVRQSHRQRLLVGYKNYFDDDERQCYWILDDDDTFPQHKISLTYPRSIDLLKDPNGDLELVGSSHGLLCFSGNYIGEDDYFDRYVIWNPSLRKSVRIDVPYNDHVFVAFGVCPNTFDPKIVKINVVKVPYREMFCDYRRFWRVEVYTLSSGVWRGPLIKLPSKWINFDFCSDDSVVLNGFIYWCACVCSRDTSTRLYMIISFDLTSEEFTKIQVPDKLAHNNFNIFKLRESLGVVQRNNKGSEEVYKVWFMDHVLKSFTKLFNVNLPESSLWEAAGFRGNNQLIMKTIDKYGERLEELVAYESCSKHFNNLGIYGDWLSFSLTSYTESLLLLDQSDTQNDDEGDAGIRGCGDVEIEYAAEFWSMQERYI